MVLQQHGAEGGEGQDVDDREDHQEPAQLQPEVQCPE